MPSCAPAHRELWHVRARGLCTGPFLQPLFPGQHSHRPSQVHREGPTPARSGRVPQQVLTRRGPHPAPQSCTGHSGCITSHPNSAA